jgi:hypothetical protein
MRKILILFLLSTISFGAWAQGDLNELMTGSLEDATRLLDGYTKPALKAFGYGLNQGWYNTAKPHKPFGVDLTISVSAVTIPNSDLFYTVDNNQLNSLDLVSVNGQTVTPGTGSAQVPTIFGPDTPPTYQSRNTGAPPFEAAGGLDLKSEIGIQAMPVPIAHLGIGLPKGFDLKIRFVPTVNIGDDAKFDLFGVGVMHDVKQYIPGIKNLPFDLSGFVGYTSMKLISNLDVTAGNNQQAEFKSSATTIQALVSKKISVLTVYGGLGYNIAKTKIAMLGDYEFEDEFGYPITLTDPIALSSDASGMRATAGLRLKLAVITLHGDYTVQKDNFNTLTVGFGINVR